jgi:uncharacterized protein
LKRNGRPGEKSLFDEVVFSFERFEWDPDKRELNIVRHGIDFRDLAPFFDGSVVARRSDRKGEVRWLAIGFFNERVISVVFTQRNESCRIISARSARRKERAAYRELYAGGA